jgi:tRNA threonylcarbamoyladenosine biosynthesis protein TsaE
MIARFHLHEMDGFAHRFWAYVQSAKVFLFYGAMGAGKTTIIEALCRYKGVRDSMSSPTFSIINQYAYMQDGVEQTVYHIDLYRLNNEQEIIQAGVEDCVYSGNICFIEWPQKAPGLFDEKAVQVHVEAIGEEEREVKIILHFQSVTEQL